MPRLIRFATFALLVLSVPTLAQGNGDPIFPANPTAPQITPAEPQPEVAPAPPRLPMSQGEIMLEGIVQAVSFTRHEFTMQATSFTLPDGGRSEINEPKFKVVKFEGTKSIAAAPYPTDGTDPHWISAGTIWPTYKVAVVGPDSGSGTPLVASLIELGGRGTINQSAFPSRKALEATIFYNGVFEHVAASGLRVGPLFGIATIGGKSSRGTANSEHPRGLALDFMVGKNDKLGDAVASYFEATAGMENVKYIIWKDHLVYPGARTNWASLPVDYGPRMTERHMDHVHVSYLENPTTLAPYLTDELIGKSKLSARHGMRKRR